MKGRHIAIIVLAALGLSLLAFWQSRPAPLGAPIQAALPASAAGSLAAGPSAPATPSEEAAGPPGQVPPGPGLPSFTDSEQNPISPQEAFERVLAAAEAGSAPAMLNLAEFYGNGWGVKQNFTERFKWSQKAGEAGDARGFLLASLGLELGLGVQADQEAARAILVKAASMGLAEAHFKLGQDLLAEPEGATQASAHLEEALKGGLPMAANILGVVYLQGVGNLAPDAQKAWEALARGAELGDPEAMKNLAVMERQGLGGPANPARALELYLAAREAGWQGLDEIVAELENELGNK